MLRRTILAAVALSLASPAVAAAGTVVSSAPTCKYSWSCFLETYFTAAPGEANDLRLNVGSSLRFSDAGAPIRPGGCTREDEHTVVCPASRFQVRLGDGDDRLAHDPPYPPPAGGAYQPTIAFGEEGDDVLAGYETADLLDGGPGGDAIRAHGGADLLVGGPGADVLDGMGGDDTIAAADAGAPLAADRADGGSGADVLDYGAEHRGVVVDLATRATGGAATGDAIAGFEGLRGGARPDLLAGDSRPNVIDGGSGADGIAGRGGGDVLGGGAGRDTIDGGAGDDAIAGGGAAGDVLRGGPGDDQLDASGGGLADGGPGDDRVRVDRPPAAPLRVRCGPGDDAASVQRRVRLARDCEWRTLGQEIEAHRRVRLSGRFARVRIRGFDPPGPPVAQGGLVLRDARTRRVLASARWRRPTARPSWLRLRPRLSRALVSRLHAGRSLAVTLDDDTGGPRTRAVLAP
ncbi:MAG TPA: calcium-binding protein [Solirubrobacteraceae bacterium]|jgi:hypothetical protein|nr:calcium-binding protein [Solirubrobacteraceae bacterium]